MIPELEKRDLVIDSSGPDSAGSLIADHAGSNGFFRSTGFHEHWTLIGFDFADYYKVALASEKNVSTLFNFNTKSGMSIIAGQLLS